jgi:hypothetical protein
MSIAFDYFQFYLISNYDFIEYEILYNNRERKLLEKYPLEEWRLKEKSELRMGQTRFFIYSGIYLQLTTRKSELNS